MNSICCRCLNLLGYFSSYVIILNNIRVSAISKRKPKRHSYDVNTTIFSYLNNKKIQWLLLNPDIAINSKCDVTMTDNGNSLYWILIYKVFQTQMAVYTIFTLE